MQRGKFITVEGIEGVGKSTNVEILRQAIEQRGIPVLTSREPGGTPLAEKIRRLLVEHGDEPLPDIAELLLMFASRALHVQNRIEPALAAGTWVVCDRFTDASRAYQGGGRGFAQADIDRLAELVHPGLKPDMTLLLDAPVATGLSRAGRRGRPDRIEIERHDFFSRVREQYLHLAAAEPDRFVVVDADASVDLVGHAVTSAINRLLDETLQEK
ncbi:MAG: dTMP kinase [Gammaproteobacteria bacterium]|nr:dTMP kinase [Gammaproteobacteria bacterium]MDH5303088.1 dTMP kinase [Gammaproteobacteria bacterium]MDH5323048.1 dTMP kinase [Gammaproteobacteria bacterium]